SRRTGAAQSFQKRHTGLLGKRHGPRPVARYVRQLFAIPNRDAGRLPPIAKDLRLHHRGQQLLRRRRLAGTPQENWRGAGGEVIEVFSGTFRRSSSKCANNCGEQFRQLSATLPRTSSTQRDEDSAALV